MKLWLCDILRNFSPLSIAGGIEVLRDHVYQKKNVFFGRIKDKIWSLRIFIDGILSKWVITLFQEIIASGKRLFMYLEERHLISWKVLILFWLYKGLWQNFVSKLFFQFVLLQFFQVDIMVIIINVMYNDIHIFVINIEKIPLYINTAIFRTSPENRI